MRSEQNVTNSGADFSEIWADAQNSRNVFIASFVLKGWRQLFGIAFGHSDQPIGGSPECAGE
jgi:hypothetical protein